MSKISPQRFGKYVLLRRLAIGGMAEIFKAKVAGAEGFEKDLVIKRILPHFSDDETFVQMFVDEARLTAKLQHPNIVQIFDFDVADDSYYIAMEYIEGKDLHDLIEESHRQHDPLSVPQCVWLAIEVAKGLHYAHTKEDKGQPLNIVHRDVTPSNVMISYRGDVKLMDFGIAKATQRSTKTQAGAVKGKVAYMSPEQARGKPIDGRTDVFALGVMLWEMLTHTRLFLAESDFDTLNNVLKMEPPRPSKMNLDVPPDLDPIVARCLAKDVNERWPNAEMLSRELTRWYYQNVPDLEKEKLKPLMFRIFKRDIDLLEQQSNEDDAFMSGGVASQSESTVMQPAARGLGPMSEERTRVEPGLRAVDTRVGPAGYVQTSTSSQQLSPVQPRRKASPLPWILLILLLAVGGVATFFVVTKNAAGTGTAATTPAASPDTASAPSKDSATLYIKIDPHTAKVKVDGKVVGGEVAGLTIGQKVRVVAEAPGYKRFEEIISIDDASPIYPIKMEKEGEPLRIVIRPSSDADQVFVDGVPIGAGAQPFEGMIGKDYVVKVVPASGGEPVTQVIKLDATMTIVNVVTPGELLITLDPADATVTASAGTLELRSAGIVAVKGVGIGTTVTIEAKAKDRRPFKSEVSLTQASQALVVRLEKIEKIETRPSIPGTTPGTTPGTIPGTRPGTNPTPGTTPTPTGTGSIQVSARPWAQITINGRPYGTTPKALELPAGKYTVLLTKGQQSVTKTVQVSGGKRADVYVDFTDM